MSDVNQMKLKMKSGMVFKWAPYITNIGSSQISVPIKSRATRVAGFFHEFLKNLQERKGKGITVFKLTVFVCVLLTIQTTGSSFLNPTVTIRINTNRSEERRVGKE